MNRDAARARAARPLALARRARALAGLAAASSALAFATAPLAPGASPAAAQAPTPAGLWRTAAGDGLVEIAPCGAALCGRLVWMKDPPSPVDRENPDPGLRARPLCGLEILAGFVPDGEGGWTGGSVYDAKSGRTYRGTLRLDPDGALSLRGYVGIPLFGRAERWSRDAGAERC